MDFTLSKQQQMVQKMYREFAENEVKPLAKNCLLYTSPLLTNAAAWSAVIFFCAYNSVKSIINHPLLQ